MYNEPFIHFNVQGFRQDYTGVWKFISQRLCICYSKLLTNLIEICKAIFFINNTIIYRKSVNYVLQAAFNKRLKSSILQALQIFFGIFKDEVLYGSPEIKTVSIEARTIGWPGYFSISALNSLCLTKLGTNCFNGLVCWWFIFRVFFFQFA